MSMDILIVFLYLAVLVLLGYVLSSVSYLLSPKEGDLEKLSAYECGFNAFNDARSGYYVSFYIMALLYIIFDIEMVVLFPWAYTVYYQIGETYTVFYAFLILLAVGFAYEWFIGSLEWR